jgi:hypothetical protein
MTTKKKPSLDSVKPQNKFILKLLKPLGLNSNDEVVNLFKAPTDREKGLNAPHKPVQKLNTTQEIDVMYLPETDDGYKYLLVIADYSRTVGASPIKDLKPETIVKAIKQIYKTTDLKKPVIIQSDNGSEFKKDFVEFYKDSSIKRIKPYRSRQNGLVENINFIIAKMIAVLLKRDELKTGKPQNNWIQYLKPVIDTYNKSQEHNRKNFDKKFKARMKKSVACKGNACRLIPVGSRVRIPLEKPEDAEGNTLGKKFRSNDIRYDTKPYKIEDIILKPDTPPLYMVNQKDRVAYTKQQLIQIDKEKENEKPELEEGFYKVEAFRKKRKNKNRIEYLVKWEDYPENQNTWESRQSLIEDIGLANVNKLAKQI